MTNPAAALPTPRKRVLEAQPGIVWDAPASEAHSVRIPVGRTALLCKAGLPMIRNLYYRLIAVLLQ
jgi:hypothetical protein